MRRGQACRSRLKVCKRPFPYRCSIRASDRRCTCSAWSVWLSNFASPFPQTHLELSTFTRCIGRSLRGVETFCLFSRGAVSAFPIPNTRLPLRLSSALDSATSVSAGADASSLSMASNSHGSTSSVSSSCSNQELELVDSGRASSSTNCDSVKPESSTGAAISSLHRHKGRDDVQLLK